MSNLPTRLTGISELGPAARNHLRALNNIGSAGDNYR